MNILYEFAEYGPVILTFISWYVLWNNNNSFFYFTLGLFINIILNLILKGIIHQPRPEFDSKNINLLRINASEYFFQHGIPFDIYGMPSGHAQMSFFITSFLFLTTKEKKTTSILLFFSLCICYQRLLFKEHSLIQVIIGAIIGTLFGYIMYNVTNTKSKGNLHKRIDDFCLL